MEPLRIECKLAGPWFPPAFGLHLDGLLAWVAVQEALTAGYDATGYEAIIGDLPLERHVFDAEDAQTAPAQRSAPKSVWCASQFIPVGWMGQERRFLTARTPVDAMAPLINDKKIGIVNRPVEEEGGSIIDTQRGPAKNSQTWYTVEHCEGLRAWCIGDYFEVIRMLDQVHAVGVKTRIGLGSLLPFDDGKLWRVTRDEAAHDMWKRRSTPQRLIADSMPAVGSWRSPYWQGNDLIWRPEPMRIPADPQPASVDEDAANAGGAVGEAVVEGVVEKVGEAAAA